MPMVDIGKVRVGMHQPRMRMRMAVGLIGWISRTMGVLVMRVVHMAVLVHHRQVLVFMCMPLGQVWPQAERHQRGSDTEPP